MHNVLRQEYEWSEKILERYDIILTLQVFISASGRAKHVMRVHNSRGIPAASSAPFADSGTAPDNIVVDPETRTHRVRCPFEHSDGAVVLVKTVKDFRDHISVDHPDKEKCCLICAKPFETKGELVEHLQTHSGKDKFVIPAKPSVYIHEIHVFRSRGRFSVYL